MNTASRIASEIAEDALDQLAVCQKTLRQLESLLWTLKDDGNRNRAHDSRIAELGAYVALDIGDLTESLAKEWRQELETLGGAQ